MSDSKRVYKGTNEQPCKKVKLPNVPGVSGLPDVPGESKDLFNIYVDRWDPTHPVYYSRLEYPHIDFTFLDKGPIFKK